MDGGFIVQPECCDQGNRRQRHASSSLVLVPQTAGPEKARTLPQNSFVRDFTIFTDSVMAPAKAFDCLETSDATAICGAAKQPGVGRASKGGGFMVQPECCNRGKKGLRRASEHASAACSLVPPSHAQPQIDNFSSTLTPYSCKTPENHCISTFSRFAWL
jgi:hypothetical protein